MLDIPKPLLVRITADFSVSRLREISVTAGVSTWDRKNIDGFIMRLNEWAHNKLILEAKMEEAERERKRGREYYLYHPEFVTTVQRYMVIPVNDEASGD
jgi:hypothetical protein